MLRLSEDVPEAQPRMTKNGLVVDIEGWFVLNARDSRWKSEGPLGRYCNFEGKLRFPQLGINISILRPGQAIGRYRRENAQEGFLLIEGECLLIVEEQERRLETWDYFHCPGGTDHISSGPATAGDRGRRWRAWPRVRRAQSTPSPSSPPVSGPVSIGRRPTPPRHTRTSSPGCRDRASSLRAGISARRRLSGPGRWILLGMASPSATLSQGQLALLAEHGEERRAAVGDILFKIGDRRYPLIAIIEGEAVILDDAGAEIIRHGASGFLGESNLLSGQTVYLTAVVTEPMRYIAVEREALKTLLFEDGPLSDLLLPRSSRGARDCRAAKAWRSTSRAAVVRGDAPPRRVRTSQPATRVLAGHEPPESVAASR